MKREGYWFKSSLFEIEQGEDDEINPQIYGRQLARWLKQRLEEQGYAVEEIINEDWGRCLMCSRDPYSLWVGCASVTDLEAADDDAVPAKEDITWHCFAAAEVFFLKRLLKKIDTEPGLAKLDADLGKILRSEPAITLVDG
jgi:hypothetical protein